MCLFGFIYVKNVIPAATQLLYNFILTWTVLLFNALVLHIRQAACAGRWLETPEQRANHHRRPSIERIGDDSSTKGSVVSTSSASKSKAGRRGSVVKNSAAKARVSRRASNFGAPSMAIMEHDNEDDENNDAGEPSVVKESSFGDMDSVELLVDYWFERCVFIFFVV